MTKEQLEEIQRLRGLEASPKMIARQLGLRPAEVSEAIRKQAIQAVEERRERGELDPVHECLVDEMTARYLLDGKPMGDSRDGLGSVIISRVERGKLSLCTFLVDYWCLGIKDADGPRRVDKPEYEARRDYVYSAYDGRYRHITVEQAQAIVYGAKEYAATLGLEPHADAARALEGLGKRPETLFALEFGQEGKPVFVNGPNDNFSVIKAKLDKSVGSDNYESVFLSEYAFDFDENNEVLFLDD